MSLGRPVAVAVAVSVGLMRATDLWSQSANPRPVALIHANVVDVEAGSVIRDATVVTRGDRIIFVGAARGARIPAGAEIVDQRGAYIIPGLWDMHVHMASDPRLTDATVGRSAFMPTARYFGSLLIANGITGVRDASGDLPSLRAIDSLARPGPSALLAPRMIYTGQKLGEFPVLPGAPFPIRTDADITKSVAMLKAAGAGFVKLARRPPSYTQLHIAVAACVAQHMPCVSHFIEAPSFDILSREPMSSYEHLSLLKEYTSTVGPVTLFAREEEASWPTTLQRILHTLHLRRVPTGAHALAVATHDSARAVRMFADLAKEGTWVTPTIIEQQLVTLITPVLGTERDTSLMLDPPKTSLRGDTRTPAQRAPAERDWNLSKQLVRELHQARVGLLAGSDIPLASVPGISLHAELILLREAALTPLEALRAATLNPALYFKGTDTLGTVRAGRVADLVVLRKNPLEDIRNVAAIEMVMTRGRLLRRPQLDSLTQVARGALAQLRRVPDVPHPMPQLP